MIAKTLSQNGTKNPKVLSQLSTIFGRFCYQFSTISGAVGAVSRGGNSTKTGNRGAGRARMGVGGTEKPDPLSLSLSLIVLYRTIVYSTMNLRSVSGGAVLNVF